MKRSVKQEMVGENLAHVALLLRPLARQGDYILTLAEDCEYLLT